MRLEAKGISFQYMERDKQILSGVDIAVKNGERVGLVAPSGRGKTTLCKILAGYERPGSGVVLLDGKPIDSYKGYCPVQMVGQHPEYAIDPRIKMREVLAEGDNIERKVIEKLGIEQGWLDRYAGELSGGELQRFCIARALGARTRILIADEITTMLDLITQGQIWSFLLDEIQRREIGLLAVSHSTPLLEHICTRQVEL